MSVEVLVTVVVVGGILVLSLALALVAAGWWARGKVADELEEELDALSLKLDTERLAHAGTEARWRAYVATLRQSEAAREALVGFGGSDADLFDRVLHAVDKLNGASASAPSGDPEADHSGGVAGVEG